jgi:magnesium-protoporphyrin O-methyltransferase
MSDYAAIRDRVEHYFDRTATRAWERLTTEEKVSRIRQTVREGRDRMRATMLSRLPTDLTGLRVLDAGCGTGAMTVELARAGAMVVAADISPKLIDIARDRLPAALVPQVSFHAGDMTDESLGSFDFVMAMDSLIYYRAPDIGSVLTRLGKRTRRTIVFTVAPRTPFLMTFWAAGKLFPRSDRSPVMVPHALPELRRHVPGDLTRIERVARGFYISDCLEYRP